MPSQNQKTDIWTRFTLFQLYGFFVAGKLFAFLAGPLLALIVFNRTLCGRMYRALTQRDPLSGVSWVLLISIMYGLCELVYGLLSGYSPVTALQILVFNFCPIYLFLGIWAGERKSGLVQWFVGFNAWYFLVFTIVYYAFFRNSSSVEHPATGSATLLGLFCFEFSLSRFWLPILVLAFDTIAAQERSDWAGLMIAVAVWGVATRKIGRVFSFAGVIVALLAIGFVFDLRMPGLPGRGGDISARDTVGRALSSFDPELAQEYNSNAQIFAGTVHWRETIWKNIRESVDQSYTTKLFGMGYGFSLPDLVPTLKGSDLRSPHSVFYFALCYSGWVGVTIFFTLQAFILALLWRVFRVTGQIYGLLFHIYILTVSVFGNFFEAPQAAIPTYIVLGICIGSLFAPVPSARRPAIDVFATDPGGGSLPSPRRTPESDPVLSPISGT